MSRCIVFDIETKADDTWLTRDRLEKLRGEFNPPANVKDPAKIAARETDWWAERCGKFALSPRTGRIVTIAWADLWNGQVEARSFDREPDSEANNIEGFADALRALGGPSILSGYNIRGFDIPFLTLRASMLGVDLPPWWPHARDYRLVADLMDTTGGGKLDEWLVRFGLPPKTADGSQVDAMTIDEVRQYCIDDVEREREFARRLAANVPLLRQTLPAASTDSDLSEPEPLITNETDQLEMLF